jgi:hypothetical protein
MQVLDLLITLTSLCSGIPATHHLTLTHPSYSPDADAGFVAMFIQVFIKEGGTLEKSIHRSLLLGRLQKTNAMIRTEGETVTVVSRLPNNLWLGAAACCNRATVTSQHGMLTCSECKLIADQPTRLVPHILSNFITDPGQVIKMHAIGEWYKLMAAETYCDLPVWRAPLLHWKPPTVRQRKRRHSEVDD